MASSSGPRPATHWIGFVAPFGGKFQALGHRSVGGRMLGQILCGASVRGRFGRGPRIHVVVIRQFRDQGRHCLLDALHLRAGEDSARKIPGR